MYSFEKRLIEASSVGDSCQSALNGGGNIRRGNEQGRAVIMQKLSYRIPTRASTSNELNYRGRL